MIVHLLRQSKHWKACKTRLFIATSLRNKEDPEETKTLSNKILDFFKRYRLLGKV